MINLKQILVPTDFSEYGAHALKYGCALAQKFGSRLHLINVVEDYYPIIPEVGVMLGERDQYLSGLRTGAERELARLPDQAWLPPERVTRFVRVGTPFVEIVRYAREQNIDLIVIGSHGRSGLAHALMGSVAEKVVQKAPCAVLTVRPGQHQFVMP